MYPRGTFAFLQGTFIVHLQKLHLRHENGVHLRSFKILEVILKIQENFSILLRVFVI